MRISSMTHVLASKTLSKQKLTEKFDEVVTALKPYCVVVDSEGDFFDGLTFEPISWNKVKCILRKEVSDMNNEEWEIMRIVLKQMAQRLGKTEPTNLEDVSLDSDECIRESCVNN